MKEDIKKIILDLGADVCGAADMERSIGKKQAI